MATGNFLKVGAKNYYAVEIEDDFSFDFKKENLVYSGKTEGWEPICDYDSSWRSYEAAYYLEKKFYFTFLNHNFYFNVRLGFRNGYYSGVNLDYDVAFDDDTCGFGEDYSLANYGDVEDLIVAVTCNMDSCYWLDYEENPGLWKMNIANFGKRLTKEWNKVQDCVEDFCARMCDVELVLTARLGNGECVYSRIDGCEREYLIAAANY